MEFRAVKGTRDFYPELMRLRNWIADAWRRVSLRNGFEEYDAPIFEYLDLFTAKSGDEIAEQLFSLTDRGGRNLAIRPEITPSLARMVNAKINSLPRPIKWFSIPRLCRAENPQKGRLREFFQWNIDVIGSDDVLADAECIFVCADFFREIGLTPADVKIRIGSRALTTELLKAIGVAESEIAGVLPVLDKRPKVSDEEFNRLAAGAGLDERQIGVIGEFQAMRNVDGQLLPFVEKLQRDRGLGQADEDAVTGAATDLDRLWEQLRMLDVAEYCELDMRVVRGLAYYTGIVYEAFDAGESLRAVAGGGRYDNLLEVLGGPKVGATGFGMGDVVLGILLEEKGKLPSLAQSVDVFVIADGDDLLPRVLEVVGQLRSRGISAEFSYARRAMGKQLKEANKRGARAAMIVSADGMAMKDLNSGQQQPIDSIEQIVQSLSHLE